jgi:pimeloyl-ACP methyl ester carboxylesterase
MEKMITKHMNSDAKDEIGINFIKEGEGRAVILIHGLGASLFDWTDFIPDLLSSGYQVYALDLPGHGKSKKIPTNSNYTIEDMYTIFCCWVENLKIDEPVVLIGHSLGSYISILYAVNHPDHVRGLVLCDPLYSCAQIPFLVQKGLFNSMIRASAFIHIPEWAIRIAVDIASLSIRNGYILSNSVRKQTVNDFRRSQPEIFQILSSMDDLTKLLPSLDVPGLIVWGAVDRTLKPESFSKLIKNFKNAQGVAIPSAGHVPHQSHTREFSMAVMEFLRSNFPMG